MHLDVESGFSRQRIGLKRRWNSLPRFVKLYLTIGCALTIFLTIIYILPKTSEDNSFSEEMTVSKERSAAVIGDDRQSNQLVRPMTNRAVVDSDGDSARDTGDEEGGSLLMSAFILSAQTHQNGEQTAIVEALKHSWSAYAKYAWGADNLKPITKSKYNWFDVGLTILDGLDTVIMMGLEREYDDAMKWITNDLRFDIYKEVNCFEMTIRALGGLLSAYQLTRDSTLLLKAADVGERLIHCFDTPNNLVPFSDVNLKTKVAKTPNWSPDSSLSEVSSVQIEFRELSFLTGIKKYEKLSFRVSQHIHNITVQTGDPLLPMYINPHNGRFSRSTITLGARADSYYEYLIKQYLQTGIQWLKEDYVKAMDEVKKRLTRTTGGPLKLTFIGEILRSGSLTDVHPKMDHLVCFLSGTLALGYYHEVMKSPKIRGHSVGDNSVFSEHLVLAEKLAHTCYMMYNSTATGLAPEITYFGDGDDEIQIRPADSHNLQRPEFVESLFYLYHITGNQTYRDWGWNVFKAFERYTKVSTGGYTSVSDVRYPENVRPRDMQETFWLAETLKYLFLLFCDDKQIVNKLLDNYVFNTEGHLFPRRIPV